MDRLEDEDMWKSVASALHRGALDHCETFRSTADAINHLYNFRDQELTEQSTTVARRHHDFYYHLDNLPGPLGLSRFFWDRVVDSCLLCTSIRVKIEGCNFLYMHIVHGTQGRVLKGDLSLPRLEHLAVMHTPYFVMFFLGLVRDKRYSFHEHGDTRHRMAHGLFEQLRDDARSTFDQGHDSFRFLKQWWRFQNKRGSRELNVSIPSYFELTDDDGTMWNINTDHLSNRKPDPMYTFLARNCLCYELRQSGTVAPQRHVDLSPRVNTLTEGRVTTFSCRALIPKVHVEDVLHSAVRTCTARQASRVQLPCSSLLEPRLDCLVLEDVGHPTDGVMMHVVTTLDSRWQTLSSWMASARGKAQDARLTVNKVFFGVMGSLRDMCLQDKIPPRHFYSGTANQVHGLGTSFLIHSETGDVLSLLPYVSTLRMYRSPAMPEDEDAFRKACANLALSVIYAQVEHDDVLHGKLQELERMWLTGGACLNFKRPWLNVLPGTLTVGDVYRFCRTGLVNEDIWTRLRPEEAGFRDTVKVDVPQVWLGETVKTPNYLRARLLALGFREPLNVSIIESLRDEEAAKIRETQHGFTTPRPETIWGLVCSVATYKNTRDAAFYNSTTVKAYTTPGRASTCVRKNKRSENRFGSEVAQKMHHADPTENALKHLRQLSRVLDAKLMNTSGSSGIPNTDMVAEMYRDAHIPRNDTGQDDPFIANVNEPSGDIFTNLHFTATSMPAEAFLLRPACEITPSTGTLGDLGVLHIPGKWRDSQRVPASGTPSGMGQFYSNTNAIYTETQANDNSCSFNLTSVLFDCFKEKYKDDHETLNRLLAESVGTGGDIANQTRPWSREPTSEIRIDQQADRPREQYVRTMELLKPRQSPRLVNRQEGRQRSPLWKALPVAAGASVPVNANTGSDVCGQTQPRPREPTPEICIDQKFFRAAEQHGQATEQLVSRQEGRRENPHRLPLPVAAGAPVQVNEDREALSEERLFLQTLPRWKSSGFPENDLKAMGYTPYQPMVFVTCDLVAAANIKLTVIDSIRRPVNVPQNSLVNLSEPRDRETWGSVTDMRPPVALTDIEPERPRTSWATGVETSKVYHIELCYPTQMVYDRRIPCSTLSCRRETQTYRTVDLSAPPEHGCKHVELITSEFPNKTQADQPKLLMIKSSDTLYLGPVCTIENITGLLVHKVFTNNVNLLEDILDMHTSLQVHPFIPRTFALHLTKLPFLCMPAVGMYVGEAAGIWNTGPSNNTLQPQLLKPIKPKASEPSAYSPLKALPVSRASVPVWVSSDVRDRFTFWPRSFTPDLADHSSARKHGAASDKPQGRRDKIGTPDPIHGLRSRQHTRRFGPPAKGHEHTVSQPILQLLRNQQLSDGTCPASDCPARAPCACVILVESPAAAWGVEFHGPLTGARRHAPAAAAGTTA
ncbi:hypothetical protein DPEC_G00068780 [Dallia pectoralis]|uniref:Uncharacterized protein n=1 Tax=Dallia pectoralis TaxID=75939 RepID=A0ACC2H1R5_DALPE|nr:hypothetical protein DPEC_G00068780 [Dallia pectoralis]